jgi:hypothetical protein
MQNHTECQELRELKEHIAENVNSLELCSNCERISECQQLLVNEAVPVWLCSHCQVEFCYRLEKLSGVPVSLLPI